MTGVYKQVGANKQILILCNEQLMFCEGCLHVQAGRERACFSMEEVLILNIENHLSFVISSSQSSLRNGNIFS